MNNYNNFSYSRTYKGPVRLVVLDWSGTVVDYGCLAPAKVFVALFQSRGVPISMEQARAPMGRYKKDHIRAIFEWNAGVRDKWQEKHGREWEESDVESMFTEYKEMQLKVLGDHNDIIPGCIEACKWMRENGIFIGGSTGFFKEAVNAYLKLVEGKGYQPDLMLCSDDVPEGRPAPWMIHENMKKAGVYPASAVVKVDDSLTGIEAGLNAGAWTVGITRAGTLVGKSQAELDSMNPKKIRELISQAKRMLLKEGAHYTIPSIADLPNVIREINAQLAAGVQP
ncbi:phosphonoacetaldehyde hydrolase [Candidatus Bathyarchaeota archaeon]|nr:phosphonoacetaldehyde hydrolase [Candidatus Bathyarchaeota archaeon]